MQIAETKLKKENDKNNPINDIIKNGRSEVKLALIKNVKEIVELMIYSVFEDEIREKAGKRYKHCKQERGIYRWGKNRGSVRIGNEKVKIDVPRLRDKQTQNEVILDSYQKLKEREPDEESLLKGVIHGISMNDYHDVVHQFEDSYGLSRSSVSKMFIEQSAKRVEEFMKRDLSSYNFISLFIDGKYLAKEQIVIALGITEEGTKIPLGFVQTTTENSISIKNLLSEVIERGFDYSEGILCVIDGSRGIHKAVEETFGERAVIKRCSWHKRENMLSYLPEGRKEEFKKKYDNAYAISDYIEAQNAFIDLSNELIKVNVSASRSVLEGLDELLTLHRLELIDDFRKSFSTTNIIENLNSQLVKYIGKVKHWKNSSQRYRWVASALVEIEPKLRKVANHINLSILKEKVKIDVEIKIKEKSLGIS